MVPAAEIEPWKSIIREGIEATWATKLDDNDHLFYLYSDNSLGASNENRDYYLNELVGTEILPRKLMKPSNIAERSLTFPTYSGWDSILHKTLSAFKYAVENLEFDFIIRTAVSSFWNPKATRNLLSIQKSRLEFGGSVKFHHGKRFVEGSACRVSRKSVQMIVEGADSVNYNKIDDVAISEFFEEKLINFTDLPRPRIERRWDFHDTRYGRFEEIYSFRCKAQKDYDNGRIPRDSKLMKQIHGLLLKTDNY